MTDFLGLSPLGAPGRTNDTPQIDLHPGDHNGIVAFVNALLAAGKNLESAFDALSVVPFTIAGALSPLSYLGNSPLGTYASTVLGAPTSGNELTLFHLASGSGIVTNFHMPAACGALNLGGRLRVYTDGNATPDVDVDLGTLFCLNYDATSGDVADDVRHTSGSGAFGGLGPNQSVTVTHELGVAPDNVQVTLNGNPGAAVGRLWVSNRTATQFTVNIISVSGANFTSAPTFDWRCEAAVPGDFVASTRHMNVQSENSGFNLAYNLRFPIPFSNGVKITLYNPGVAVGAGLLWSQVQYLSGVTAPFRLSSVGSQGTTSLIVYTNTAKTVFDITGTAGWLVWFALSQAAVGAGPSVDQTYLERPVALDIDGAGYELFSDGTEDFFQTSWYGESRFTIQEPCAMVTGANGPGLSWNGGLDCLALWGGVPFSSSLALQLQQKTPNNVDTNCDMQYAALFYVPH